MQFAPKIIAGSAPKQGLREALKLSPRRLPRRGRAAHADMQRVMPCAMHGRAPATSPAGERLTCSISPVESMTVARDYKQVPAVMWVRVTDALCIRVGVLFIIHSTSVLTGVFTAATQALHRSTTPPTMQQPSVKEEYAIRLEGVPLPQKVVTPTADVLSSIEEQLKNWGTEKGAAEAFKLFPERPDVGETVTAPPLPKARRPPVPDGYSSRTPGQNPNWVEQMRRTSAPKQKVPSKAAARKPLPPFVSSPSGKWKTPLTL